MAETILLDPTAVATNRTQLDITAFVSGDGIDWGDAAIEQYVAEASRGQVAVDFRVPNRTITIPLKLRGVGATSFDSIRQSLQAKTSLFQREGGWLSRQTSIGTVYADVVGATLRLGGSWAAAFRSVDTDAVLTLECIPDFYGNEITLDDMSTTTAAELVGLLKQSGATATIKGNYPARARIVVDEDQGVDQRGLIWGLRSRNYSSAATAALQYEAEALTPLDAAAITTSPGGSGGNKIAHGTLSSSTWSPVLSTDIAGVGPMTHVGTYRVWVRAHESSTDTSTSARLVWDVGDLVQPVENDPVDVPGQGNGEYYLLDLGEVRLDPAPIGTHRWRGYVQAKGTLIGIDKLWLVPVDEGYGVLKAPTSTSAGLVGFSARDSFTGTTSGGTLNTRTPPVGAAWATSGAAADFTFIDANAAALNHSEAVARSDGGTSYRFGVLGPSLTNMRVSARLGIGYDASHLLTGGYGLLGVVARWADANNHVRFTFDTSAGGTGLLLVKVVAGTTTTLATKTPQITVGVDWTLALSITTAGVATASFITPTASDSMIVTDSALATAGALASGKGGIADRGDGGTSYRWYDDVQVTGLPPSPAVMYASQGAHLRWDGMYRKTIAGDSAGSVAVVSGDLTRLPPSGIEARPVEMFLKASRGNIDDLPDGGIDDISAQVFYRPSFLFVPES